MGMTDVDPLSSPEILQTMAAQYDAIVSRINEQIRRVVDLVTRHHPVSLMMRCHLHFLRKHDGVKESEMGEEENTAMHLPAYVQSIIVSNEQVGQAEISAQDFSQLVTAFEDLHSHIIFPYLLASEGKRHLAEGRGRDALDRAVMEHHLRWLAIRSDRHIKHDFQFLREFLNNQSGLIQHKFGLVSEDIVTGLEKLYGAFTQGINDLTDEEQILRAEWQIHEAQITEAFQQRQGEETELIPEQLKMELGKTFADLKFGERFSAVRERHYDGSVFDVLDITGWPEPFVEALAFSAGEDTEFMAGEQGGWPIRLLPIMKKPFLKWENRYYFFDVFTLFDYIFHNIRDATIVGNSRAAARWQETQGKDTERTTLETLDDLLPGAAKVGTFYYDYLNDEGRMENAEGDGLLLYARHLLLVEVKGGRTSHRSPDGKITSYLASVRTLLSEPVTQAERFLKELHRVGHIVLRSKRGDVLLTLNVTDFDQKYILTTTVEHLGEYTANLEGARTLGVAQKNLPVFSVQLDDLRVIRDLLTLPAEFLHFLDQRMKARDFPQLSTTDEMVHFALYLKSSQYTRLVDEAHMDFSAVKDDIDTYYHRLWNEETPNPRPRQEFPGKYGELVAALSDGNNATRIRAAKYLLNLDTQTRKEIAEVLAQLLAAQRRDQRVHPLHTGGENSFTLFAFTPSLPRAGWEAVACRRSTLAAMKARGEEVRLLLRVFLDDRDRIVSVLATFLSGNDVKAEPAGVLDPLVQAFRETVARKEGRRTRERKINPNEPCPCGSGIKFKKCHGKPRSL